MSFKDKFNSFFDIDEEQEDMSYYEDYDYDTDTRSFDTTVERKNKPRPVNNQNLAGQSGGYRAEIRIVEPRVSSEVEGIADILLEQKIVIVNFKKTKTDDAKKMIDYLNGVTYAVGGKIQRIGEEIFLMAPNGIDVDGDDLIPLADLN